MTREDLLKRSISEFADKKENCFIYNTETFYDKSGYAYIIKKEPRPLSCAFHFRRSLNTNEEFGRFESQSFSLNTREKIPFGSLIEYKDLVVMVSEQGGYNETMGQWHYSGVGAFTPISSQFLIKDEADIVSNIGTNSLSILLECQKDYPYFPAFFQPNTKLKFVMVDCEDGGEVGGAIGYNAEGLIDIDKCDFIKLSFVNFTRDEALRELWRLQELSKDGEAKFGFMSMPTLKNRHVYQTSFNWKSLSYVSEFRINYRTSTSVVDEVKTIKRILHKAFSTL